MLLQEFQQALQNRYDLCVPYPVDNFFCNDEHWLKQLFGYLPDTPEMLLIREHGEDLDVTLFIAKPIMHSLQDRDIGDYRRGDQFNNWCIALEGVSHFVYLLWNAGFHKPVKLLEMELQAEVDKFITASAYADVDAGSETVSELWTRIFQDIKYSEKLSPTLQARYMCANYHAKRYCQWLAQTFTLSSPNRQLNAELARFYRMTGDAKIAHIDTRHQQLHS